MERGCGAWKLQGWSQNRSVDDHWTKLMQVWQTHVTCIQSVYILEYTHKYMLEAWLAGICHFSSFRLNSVWRTSEVIELEPQKNEAQKL